MTTSYIIHFLVDCPNNTFSWPSPTHPDMALGPYDEDRYVDFLYDIHQEYSGLGTAMPARWVQQWYSATYYWPNVTPLPPIGNPSLKGIIAGQMFDPATPYIWTQVSFFALS